MASHVRQRADLIKSGPSPRPRHVWLFICVLLLSAGYVHAQGDAAAPVKKQLPADQRAFKTAQAIVDPEQRLAAMRAFVKDYPKSNRVDRAQGQILTILINNFPDRATEVDAQARLRIKSSGKGSSHWDREVEVAWLLAEGGSSGSSSGIDLPFAEKIAADAVKHSTEEAYDRGQATEYAKYKLPLPKPAAMHKQFESDRAEALAVLGDVYLRENKPDQAAGLIEEAFKLDPLVDDVNSQRARLALVHHDDALALDSFERAELVGAVSEADRKKTLELYRAAHAGSDAGFPAELDARYTQLFPPPFTAERAKPTAGHTVLLELFTGSACGPCVGGDLAADALLGTYPRSQLVVLAFDQHIPEPDPLANPDSVARAGVYTISGTPTFAIDGLTQDFYGGDRDGSKELYDKLAKLVDAAAAVPGSVALQLSADAASGGTVHAHVTGQLPDATEITRLIAARPKPEVPSAGAAKTDAKADSKTDAKTPAAPSSAAAPAAAAQLIVNFALVEDDIRYSGENGIRFHRMVVRSLAKPADSGFPVTPGGSFHLDASFDPAGVSAALTAYLDDYEQHNERFGKITFISKDTSIRPSHLGVAVWLQDSVTHRVLGTAFVPVGDPQKEAE